MRKNIGYIKITSWVDAGNLSEKIDECVNDITKRPIIALIIDVRGNGGGDSQSIADGEIHDGSVSGAI